MTKHAKSVIQTASSNIPIAKSPWKEISPGKYALSVHVKPGARSDFITGINEECVSVQISAPPREGEANEKIVEFMAQIFNLKKRNISLLCGLKSREKIMQIQTDIPLIKLQQILNEQIPREKEKNKSSPD